jgi:hypothetical protein
MKINDMNENNKQRRNRIKHELIGLRGGKCKACGYKKSESALCFHHVDHNEKQFNVSGINLTRKARALVEEEAAKCDVYCLNCHAELHDAEGWVHEDGKVTPK